MKVSLLKMPVKSPTPLPSLLVRMSPWYQARPNGLFGTWRRKVANSVFGGRLNTSTCMFWTKPKSLIVTRPRALGERQATAPADTFKLKVMLSPVAAFACGAMPVKPAAAAMTTASTVFFIHSPLYVRCWLLSTVVLRNFIYCSWEREGPSPGPPAFCRLSAAERDAQLFVTLKLKYLLSCSRNRSRARP